MIEKIIECIVTATDRDELKTIGPDESFSTYDIDSLDMMSIMVEVEGAFDIELDGVEPKDATSINAYVKLIAAKVAEK